MDSDLKMFIGCSGWYYWHWRGKFYPTTLPPNKWFEFYQNNFNSVELNAPFYQWPRPQTIKSWCKKAKSGFVYSVKVNRMITHLKRFRNTINLVKDFYKLLEPLEEKLGCILFQLPPSFSCDLGALDCILEQLDYKYTNVIEFRHPSWWNEQVFARLRSTGTIFCSVSAPSLPEIIVTTSSILYIRFHGKYRWYRYKYTTLELSSWKEKILNTGSKICYVYFNNDRDAAAPANAMELKNLLSM